MQIGTDPYNLQRFLNAQESTFDIARAELAAGPLSGSPSLTLTRGRPIWSIQSLDAGLKSARLSSMLSKRDQSRRSLGIRTI